MGAGGGGGGGKNVKANYKTVSVWYVCMHKCYEVSMFAHAQVCRCGRTKNKSSRGDKKKQTKIVAAKQGSHFQAVTSDERHPHVSY